MLRKNHLNLNVKKIKAVKDSSFALAKELNLAMKSLVKFYTLYMCRSRRVTFMLWRRGSQAVSTSVFGCGGLGSIPAIVSFR